MTPRRCLGTLLVALVSLVMAAACSVPTHEEPAALRNSVPDQLLETTTTTPTTTPPGATKQVAVYFLRSVDSTTFVQQVTRTVDISAGVEATLQKLFRERPREDRPTEAGLRTAIPESATLLSATRSDADPERLVVDVRGLFGSLQGADLRNALAQIVYTATETGTGVDEVVFRREGEPVQALTDDLESVGGPVQRVDYLSLAG